MVPAAELRELRNALYMARRTIVDLMPEHFAKLLTSYHRCKSTREYHAWCGTTAEQIVSLVPAEEIRLGYDSRRTACPLCKGLGHGPHPNGFTVPEGLHRHLTGYGNAHHCDVTQAAFELGRDFVQTHYGAAEAKAKAEADAVRATELAQRRLTEVIYRIDPFEAPRLVDEGSFVWMNRARDAEGVAWAERRAIALGFRSQLEGNVKTVALEAKDYIVFADIRQDKRIEFAVFRQPLKKKKQITRQHFYLQDSWKNDLQAKFAKALAAHLLDLKIVP